jgi:hypothetical protein
MKEIINHPIQFSIPTNRILNESVDKEHCFSHISPGKSKYSFETEDEYYRHYASCYFAVTREKAGWDCMRHYEILASGCVPYFLDLENCPKDTMFRLPKKLLMSFRKLPGMPSYEEVVTHAERDDLWNLSFNWDKFDKDRYFELLDELKSYTKSHLTTKSMAEYFVDKLPYEVNRVLFVSQGWTVYNRNPMTCYQRDCLVTGLNELDIEVYTTKDLWWLYDDVDGDRALNTIKKHAWGGGFTITRNIPCEKRREYDGNPEGFDAVIISTSYNMGVANLRIGRGFRAYERERLIYVDGDDGLYAPHERLGMCGITFKRELEDEGTLVWADEWGNLYRNYYPSRGYPDNKDMFVD